MSIRAVILAAGRGRRMGQLTDDRPKCLLEVRSKPLIEWQIAALTAAGASEIAVVTGYQRERLAPYGLVEFHNSRWADSSMVTSLACADLWLKDRACIVSYSDIFYDCEAVVSLANVSADIAITYDPNWLALWAQRFTDPLDDAETFRVSKSGRLLEIGGRPTSIEEIEGQFMGLIRIAPQGWAELCRILSTMTTDEIRATSTTDILQRVVLAERVSIQALAYEGEWGEVDSEIDLSFYNSTNQ